MTSPPGSPERTRRADDDRGVVLVLIALSMVAILVMAAIVIDFGFVRNTRQDNKRLGDVTTAAGLQSLAPDGVPLPWSAVCDALDYLRANEPAFSSTLPTYLDGTESPVVGNPCASLLTQECDPDDKTTWAWIRLVDGSSVIDIRSGYVTPDPAFPEDSGEYAADVSDPEEKGCDQIAVIIGETDGTFFGGAAGATGYDTVSRSVGRVVIDDDNEVAIALVLLEQEDCQSLNFSGGGGSGEVAVRGTADRPGIIHSDSAGTGDGCPGNPVIVGKQNAGPRVRALSAPDDPDEHGVISTYAQFTGLSNGAIWTNSRTAGDTHVWMCDPDSGLPGPSTCDTGPVGNKQVTREPADDIFLASVTALRGEARVVFNQIAGSPATGPSGYTRYTSLVGGDCDLTGGDSNKTVTAAEVPTGRLYIDCATELRVGNGKQLVIESGITHVAFRRHITLSGTGTLDIRDARQVLVHNEGGVSAPVATGSQGILKVNANDESSCVARHADDPDATTEMVVRRGGISSGAGATLWMCSTFVHLMGGATSSNAPVDTAAAGYPAPYTNSQDGIFDVGGGGSVQWTAPNTESAEPTVGSYRFEDLAVWSEAQANNEIRGGGEMVLVGVFFLPNTGPTSGTGGFTVAGTSSGDINLDAQLWVRKFDHNGTPRFRMRANPADSIEVPFLEGVSLVR